jgi:hypothetical protein
MEARRQGVCKGGLLLDTNWHPDRRHYSTGQGHESLSSAYAQLGLSADATLDEVKGAYRKLALQW